MIVWSSAGNRNFTILDGIDVAAAGLVEIASHPKWAR